MKQRFLRAILVSALAWLLAVTPSAWAAVGYKIRVEPQRPVVGQEAVITVSTTVFGSGGNGASPEPFPMAEFPWEFVADAPSGVRHTIVLTPAGASQSEWNARFTFDESGDWEIGLHPRHLVQPPDPALGARATVTVVSTESDGFDGSLTLVAVAAVGAVLAILGLGWRPSRPTQAHDLDAR